jgi:hypothetical protein
MGLILVHAFEHLHRVVLDSQQAIVGSRYAHNTGLL